MRLMFEFAADAYPGLNPHAALDELDELGRQARELVNDVAGSGVAARLEAVSQLLHEDARFRGNQAEYYDPRNSYLNEVITRRLGIPISLAIVYLAIGRLAGLDLYGVGTPGHFVVGCASGGETWYLDPFTDGAVLDEYACRERIHRVLGQADVLTSEHFRPATTREIAARVLRNLKAAYAMQNAWPAALPVQLRLTALLPELADERRDLGLIYLRNGDAFPAVALLEKYVETSGAADRDAALPFLRGAPHGCGAELSEVTEDRVAQTTRCLGSAGTRGISNRVCDCRAPCEATLVAAQYRRQVVGAIPARRVCLDSLETAPAQADSTKTLTLPSPKGRGVFQRRFAKGRAFYFVAVPRKAIARRTAGGSGASSPFTAYHRISFSSKSFTRSYSLKSILLERSAP